MSIPTREEVEAAAQDWGSRGRKLCLDADAALRAEIERLSRPRTFAERAANALADEVAVLITRRVLDARSPVADALLDYREGMTSERADRIAKLAAEVERLKAEINDHQLWAAAFAASPEGQAHVMWGRRAMDAEAEVERLKAALHAAAQHHAAEAARCLTADTYCLRDHMGPYHARRAVVLGAAAEGQS